jgi:hypothetical protein
MTEFRIDHLRDDDHVSEFDCDEPKLTEFLRDLASVHECGGFGRTYVMRDDDPTGTSAIKLLGFYTIAMARIHVSELPQELRARLPSFPMPVALVGQLARDRRTPRESKLGEVLLKDALERILDISDIIGCSGVVLDALNEKLVNYYGKFGFIALPRNQFPRKMFLPLHDARAARSEGGR